MRRRLLAAVICSALTSPWAPAALEQPAPWAGIWQLDPTRSTERPGAVQYRRSRVEIEPSGDGLKVVYDMVGMRGGRTHLEWMGAFDGRDYPVQGLDYVLTNAYRRIGPSAYDILVKLDGREVATTRVEISPDGGTMTTLTTERDASGQVLTLTAVYVKQS